jgi:hypothetical protein
LLPLLNREEQAHPMTWDVIGCSFCALRPLSFSFSYLSGLQHFFMRVSN